MYSSTYFRLESLLHAQFVERGQSGASIAEVVWQFVRTRLLVGSVVHLFGTLISLAGPVSSSKKKKIIKQK